MGKGNSLDHIMQHKATPFVVLAVIIITSLVFHGEYLASLKTLPSPLYGGDYYFQHGGIEHIRQGGNPLLSGSITIGGPWFSVGYSAIVGYTAMFLGISSFASMKLWSILSYCIGVLFVYLLGKKLFGKWGAIIMVATYSSLFSFPVFKYADFSILVLLPMVLYTLHLCLYSGSWKHAVVAGIVGGIYIISHGTSLFIFGLLGIAFAIIDLLLWIKDEDNKKETWRQSLLSWMKLRFLFFSIIALVAACIGLLYWWYPITSGLHNYQDSNSWAESENATLGLRLGFFFNTIKNIFFRFDSLLSSITSILTIAGLLSAIMIKDKEKRYVLFAMVAVLLVIALHPIFLFPAGIYLSHEKLIGAFRLFFITIFSTAGAFFLYSLLAKRGKNAIALVGALLIIFLCYQPIITSNGLKENPWHVAGTQDLLPEWAAFQEYYSKNLDENTIIVSNNEISFAANALTGIKTLQTRKAHNWPFVDVDALYTASAVVLYGNDSISRAQIIEHYNISYLLWESRWVTLDYYFDENGGIIGYSDPLLVLNTQENRDLLTATTVPFATITGFIDPSVRTENTKQYDLILILPGRPSYLTPWSESLDEFLLDPIVLYENESGQSMKLYPINRDKTKSMMIIGQ